MAEAVPVGASTPAIRKVDLDRPWSWLAAGWRDLTAAPSIGITYGVVFALVGWSLTFGLYLADAIYLILPLSAGFLILGPILAVGLYDVSRKRERGQTPSLGSALMAYRANPSQIAFMGVTLLLLFIAWIRLAVMIFFLFFGLEPPNPEAFVGTVFFSPASLPFLIVGTAVGAILSALAFALSAMSIPLLLDRPGAHVVTGIATSFKAIIDNPATMTFWAALIVLFIAAGLITFYLGLIVALPLIGHATWHAYRDVVG
ncbi:MAG: DUF2189 domain-containing protein [Geminicoccaceae bacterium]|nr:DUF2189 domain-containing protein [Geminicoccaceae bacterium]